MWNSNKNCFCRTDTFLQKKQKQKQRSDKLVLPTSNCLYGCLQWQLLLCKLELLHTFRTVCFLSDKYAIGSWQIVKRLAWRVFCDNRSSRQVVYLTTSSPELRAPWHRIPCVKYQEICLWLWRCTINFGWYASLLWTYYNLRLSLIGN